MDSAVLKKTQEYLGKVIKKPPLTEKLLNKPPFRFLHDIVTEVIRSTGQLEGLYTADELNSANITNKESKIAFLQKAIDCIGLCTGQALHVRPSKVVAGHEPERTNELLQRLGKICTDKIDTRAAVKQVVEGKSKKASAGKARQSSSKAESKKKGVAKNPEAVNIEAQPGKAVEVHTTVPSERVLTKEQVLSEGPTSSLHSQEAPGEASRPRQDLRSENQNQQVRDKELPASNIAADGGTRPVQRPSSAKGQRRKPQSSTSTIAEPAGHHPEQANKKEDRTAPEPDTDETEKRPKRPSSARPAPPKPRQQPKEDVHATKPTSRSTGSSQQSIIVDKGNGDHGNVFKDDDDEDTFEVVQEGQSIPESADADSYKGTQVEHGSLVTKLLSSKQQNLDLRNVKGPVAEPSSSAQKSSEKQRQVAQRQINELRNSIQSLCSSTHPLGKIMDYVQEDMDAMKNELNQWRQENRQHSLALKEERLSTENHGRPLQLQLAAVDGELLDMTERIATIKASVLQNNARISGLVSSIVH